MGFYSEEIAPIGGRIEEYLKSAEFEGSVRACTDETFCRRYLPALIGACTGGKCLRGHLVSLGYFAAAREALPDIRPAAAFEVFQGGILAHDDIIDESPLRRGKPALHMALGGGHTGISRAICLGDLCISLAEALIVRSDFPAEEKLHALQCFSDIVSRTAAGEVSDIDLAGTAAGEDDIFRMYALKTAHYTLAGPLEVGAALGGADGTLIEALRTFGMAQGIAFQINDDIAGIFSEEDATGKSLSDAEEGKSTLLTAYFAKNAPEHRREEFFSLYGKRGLTRTELERIRTLLSETGAKEYAKERARELTAHAKECCESLPAHAAKRFAALCDLLGK